MKRVLFNVPKWHLLLHREFRELQFPNDGDDPRLRLEDELFERLHAGELDALPADEVNPAPPEEAGLASPRPTSKSTR